MICRTSQKPRNDRKIKTVKFLFLLSISSVITDIRLHLENSKSKKGHNFVKKWRITSPIGVVFPFDSEQLF